MASHNKGILIIDDLFDVEPQEVKEKITIHAVPSYSYIILLIGATIICTLGLLTNAGVVIIGGMIISPLMWPLLKTSLGISYADKKLVTQALVLIAISIIVSLFSSIAITLFAPIKNVSDEIISRTNPTILDIIIALVSGAIGALAISQRKISESLAGVAIATSLMPPLCVAGIGFALINYSIATGGMLLFLANAISIIAACLFVFLFVGVKRTDRIAYRKKATIILLALLIVISAPLLYYLQNTLYRRTAYTKSEQIFQQTFSTISQEAVIENIAVSAGIDTPGVVKITANVLVPDSVELDYLQKQILIDKLEKELDRNVELSLRLQKTLSIVSENDRLQQNIRELLANNFISQLETLGEDLEVDSLETSMSEESIVLHAIVLGNPSDDYPESFRKTIEDELTAFAEQPVQLNMEIVPRIKLKSEPELRFDKLRQELNRQLSEAFPDIDISSISIAPGDEDTVANISIRVPRNYRLQNGTVNSIKASLEEEFEQNLVINIDIIEQDSMAF